MHSLSAKKRTAFEDLNVSIDNAQKRMVWIPHEREGFVLAAVQGETDDTMAVHMAEPNQTLTLSKEQCLKVNPPKFEKVS